MTEIKDLRNISQEVRQELINTISSSFTENSVNLEEIISTDLVATLKNLKKEYHQLSRLETSDLVNEESFLIAVLEIMQNWIVNNNLSERLYFEFKLNER